jgi:hypothetical protein
MVVVSSGFGEEFAGIDFGDKRLTNRVVRIAERLGKHCNLSIPAATTGRAEMEAAYRFMDNPKVQPEKLIAPHRQATLERIRQCEVALLVQDTTELDVTRPSQQVKEAGPLSHNSRRGSYLHPLIAFNGDGLALGVAWYKHWVREEISTGRTEAEKRSEARSKPIEEKESYRWLEGVRAALEAANQSPETQCIVIGDSESDIYEVLAEPRTTEDGRQLEIIVRSSGDRSLEMEEGEDKLYARVRSTPCLFRLTIDVSKRTQKSNVKIKSPRKCSRNARSAEVEVRAATVTIRSPRNSRRRPSLTYNVVLIEETSPPEGEPPIQWLLITSLPIETLEDVEKIIRYYCHRWQIEIYFRTLKSGCRVQERYFETMDRLHNCLAIYLVIAWKILYLCRLGEECPDLPCDVIFSDSEWKAVYAIVHRETPRQPPSINEMIRLIASLGGYVIRNSTKPGTQTLWIGLQRMHDLANAWETFGPESPPFE